MGDYFWLGGSSLVRLQREAYTLGALGLCGTIWRQEFNDQGLFRVAMFFNASKYIDYVVLTSCADALVPEFNRTQRHSCARECPLIVATVTDYRHRTGRKPRGRRVEKLESQVVSPLEKRNVEGKGGLVSATVSPIAVYAGIRASSAAEPRRTRRRPRH